MYNGLVNPFGDTGWRARRDGLHSEWPTSRQAGPYRVGPLVRKTLRGSVWLAVSEDDEHLLEFEHYIGLKQHMHSDPEGAVMLDLAQVMGLRHPHLAFIEGAGLFDGVPYAVRAHRPGRTLAEVLSQDRLPVDAAIGIAYALSEVLGQLAEEGPQPGACAMGGFEAEDVFLGFDGSILLTGAGLKQVRSGADAPLSADVTALSSLAHLTLPGHSWAGAEDCKSWGRILRTLDPEACGMRTANVGRLLRQRYGDVITGERAALGLPALH